VFLFDWAVDSFLVSQLAAAECSKPRVPVHAASESLLHGFPLLTKEFDRRNSFISTGPKNRISPKGAKRCMVMTAIWDTELKVVVDRIRMARSMQGQYLFCTRKSQPNSASGFNSVCHRTMKHALDSGVIKGRVSGQDIRPKTETADRRSWRSSASAWSRPQIRLETMGVLKNEE